MSQLSPAVGKRPTPPLLAITIGLFAAALVALVIGDSGGSIDPLKSAATTRTAWSEFRDWVTTGLEVWTAGPLALRAIAVIVVGLGLAWFYRRLRYNEWHPVMALMATAGLAGNAVTYHAVANDPTALAFMAACGTLVTVIRRLESVGDVQAEIGFGIALPMLLAGPPMALLILPVAAISALADPIARKDPRA